VKNTVEFPQGYKGSNGTSSGVLGEQLDTASNRVEKYLLASRYATRYARCFESVDAPGLDLNVFILKYTAITVTLVKKDALSTLDRVGRLLDGLSTDLRKKALCQKKLEA
jgi:hypothetical protein